MRRSADELAIRREELIASCMHDAGFEYQPDPLSGSFSIGTDAFDDIQSNNREWVMLYGFGIVSGHRHRNIPTRQGDDPNAEYLASLSESERAAFHLALMGPPDSPSDGHADWTERILTRGCWGPALIQAMDENPLFIHQSDEFTPLFDAIYEMHTNIFDEPDFLGANNDWSNCMADAGRVGLAEPGDAVSHFFSLLFQTEVWADAVEDHAEFTRLQNEEIEWALTDLDCREATNFDARISAIYFRVETQFVTDNRQALEAYRAASEQRD